MNLTDFRQLSHKHRTLVVRTQGVFLASRTEEMYSNRLYDMGKFFAEIWMPTEQDLADDPEQEFVLTYKDVFLLEPYLQVVDLSELIN